MRKLIGASIIVMLFVVGCSRSAVDDQSSLAVAAPPPGEATSAVGKEPTYSSEKPLYAAVAVDEAGGKVLTLVFDESKGTGKGYDTLYADLNFNGDLTDDQAIKGTFRGDENYAHSSFPAIDVPVPYNNKAQGIEKPCQFTLQYYEFKRGEQTDQNFMLSAKIKLGDEAGQWQYSLSTALSPAENPEGVLTATLGGATGLQLTLAPGAAEEGNVGIGATVTAGMGPLSCTKDGQPVKSHGEVRDEQGVAIHSEDVDAEKLVPG